MDIKLREEFEAFVKSENEKWEALKKIIDESMGLQTKIIDVLDRLTK